jgi:hypothetical protein
MIFCHIIDDYLLQNALANLKQKKYWEDYMSAHYKNKSLQDSIYKHDYIVALVCHAFEWSFMINLPIVIYMFHRLDEPKFIIFYSISMIVNTIIHAFIDNLKANKLSINLVTDQVFHLAQIFITCGLFNLFIV